MPASKPTFNNTDVLLLPTTTVVPTSSLARLAPPTSYPATSGSDLDFSGQGYGYRFGFEVLGYGESYD